MIRKIIILSALCLSLVSCAFEEPQDPAIRTEVKTSSLIPVTTTYYQISQEKAMEIMQSGEDCVTVDVRRQDEYDSGHIPKAILIPNETIGTERPKELPNLDQVILIYCRSGRRSKEASKKLADMGYTNIFEFGGIIDWTGEIVKEEK